MKITEKQFEDLTHYNDMFDNISDIIKDLCLQERFDIEYGYTLGKVHSLLRDKFIKMRDTLSDIENKRK